MTPEERERVAELQARLDRGALLLLYKDAQFLLSLIARLKP